MMNPQSRCNEHAEYGSGSADQPQQMTPEYKENQCAPFRTSARNVLMVKIDGLRNRAALLEELSKELPLVMTPGADQALWSLLMLDS